MATINLGSIKFNWKGAFNNSTAYAVDDVVSSGGNSYVCIQASQGNAVGNATAYWNIMSAAGTNGSNGTDLSSTLSTRGDLVFKNASALARLAKGTAGQVLGQGANDPAWVNGSSSTLTTQGDILFRDSSGLQRLAKGSAGQVLKMNSAANAPEYGTVSSDYVKIASGAFNDVSNVDFAASLFVGSTYKSFINMIELEDQDGGQSGNSEFRPMVSGSPISGTAVSSCGIAMNSSSNTVSGLGRDAADSCIIYNDGVRESRALLQIESNGMNRSDCNNNHFINNIRPNHDGAIRCRWDFHAVHHNRTASSADGYRIQMNAGAKGTYCLYGRK